MVISALNNLYNDLCKAGELPEIGFSRIEYKYVLSIDKNGEITDFFSVKNEKKEKSYAILPAQSGRTSGKDPYFLADNAGYILGFPGDDSEESITEAKEKFEASKDYHLRILEGCDEPWATALKNFFTNWNPAACLTAPCVQDFKNEKQKGGNIIFRVDGRYIHNEPSAVAAWKKEYLGGQVSDETKKIICSVTLEEDVLESTHPHIAGVKGTRPSGAALISYNQEAFTSYNLNGGENAQIGKKAAFCYASALNYLLSKREFRRFIGNTTLVFWAEGGDPKYSELTQTAIFGGDSSYNADDLINIIKKLSGGYSCEFDGSLLQPDTKFYLLGLTGNGARCAVSFFYRNSFGSLMSNVNAHQERLRITGEKKRWISIKELLGETVRNADTDKINPSIAKGLFNSVLFGRSYPGALCQNVILRIRSGDKITPAKAAIIKAFYIKNPNSSCKGDVLQMGLNESSTNVPYLLGRLFETYEEIQIRASGKELNATIKDRYFNSASVSPSTIFPVLARLSQAHLKKIKEPGTKIYFDRRIQDILSSVETFPSHLNLNEQSAFILGYYHQKPVKADKDENKSKNKTENKSENQLKIQIEKETN